MAGNAGSKEYFDPFQVFEVEEKPCHQLSIIILRGRNIVEAAKNFVDKPDPYIKLKLPSTLSPDVKFSARSEIHENDENPDWNLHCSFLLDLQRPNILNIELYDEGVGTDKIIGISVFDLNKLDKDRMTSKTFTLECKGHQGPAELDVELLLEENNKPDLRFSLCLCDDEKEFLAKRQEHVFESLKNIYGDKAIKSMHDVPGVGVVHSGGGFRSMIATCGVLQGLHEAGLLDTISYMSCSSGSTWYLSHLYSHHDWPDDPPGELSRDLKTEVTSSFTKRLLKPDVMYKNVKATKKKKKSGQPVSFTDFFGYLLGKTLQPNRLETKLSEHGALLKSGKVPMPIFAACSVKNDVIASKFHEWIECTAFEIAMAKYGVAMKTEQFGSKFFMGRLVKQHPEPPLHFFQGIWGSVWAIALEILVNVLRKFGACCCKNTSLTDSVVPANSYAESVLIAKKLRGDLHEREDELPEEKDVITLNPRLEELTEDSDEGDNTPAWYQHLHHSAEQNALAKFRDPESTPKSKRANQVSPMKNEALEMEEAQHQGEEEEADPMSFLDEIVKLLSKDGIIGTKTGRAATIYNYLYGLDLKRAYPLSPFTQFCSKKNARNSYPVLDVSMDTEQDLLCMVDAGVSFKLPFPPLLRPQRNVDIFLSFDYTFKSKEYSPMFKELKAAEAWAKANHVPFPKIDESIFDKEGLKEVYLFQNVDDPLCPVVLHFPLVNLTFKDFKKPGVMRETKEEKEFADFEINEDGEDHNINLTFGEKDFDRLVALMEYNVLNNSHMIKDAIVKRLENKKKQRKSRFSIYEKAIGNMANEDVFQAKLCETLQLDAISKIPSSRKTVIERFTHLVQGNEEQ